MTTAYYEATNKNSVFLSQHFSQNSIFQSISVKFQTNERHYGPNMEDGASWLQDKPKCEIHFWIWNFWNSWFIDKLCSWSDKFEWQKKSVLETYTETKYVSRTGTGKNKVNDPSLYLKAI